MFPLSSRRSRGKMNINTTLQKPLDLSKKSINEIKEATPIEKHSGIQIIVDSKETNLLKKDKIYLSAYFGRDQFSAAELFKFGWGNWTSTLRWNRVISPKWFFNASAVYSDYKYQLGADGTTPFEWDSRIRNLVQNATWTYYIINGILPG